MKFSVQHSTRYDYSAPVWDSFNDAHLCPVSDEFQDCQGFALEIEPTSPSILRRLDFYTNQVHHFELMDPHEFLEVTANSVVETFEDTRDLSVESPFAALKGLGQSERYYDFLATSPFVALTPMMQHEAKELLSGLGCARKAVETIMAFIHKDFEYAPGSTVVESTVAEVFQQKRGVCQDFAHLMIALCRVSEIPTRYVSGYFFSERHSDGAVNDNSVSHAWVECFLPQIGWVGYDPTHNRRAESQYIKLAVGRDYGDVRPLAGTYRGEGAAEMKVSVVVERLD